MRTRVYGFILGGVDRARLTAGGFRTSICFPKLIAAVLGVVCAANVAMGQTENEKEPGGDDASAVMAQKTPDEFAWRLFLFVNRQAETGKAGIPETGKTITSYDPDRPVVWETWALASGAAESQVGSEVYKPDGSDPGPWSNLQRGPATTPQKLFSVDNTQRSVILFQRSQNPANARLFIAPLNPVADNEVRMNQANFEFIRERDLYYAQGLQAELQKARSGSPIDRERIQFPAAAKEIKADWIEEPNPTPQKLSRYHWRKVGEKTYLLTGFHIITKDLKQWFWADFAHVDFETRTTSKGPLSDGFPSVDTTTRGAAAPARGSVDGERVELSRSKWANYRLRGTQIDFVDANGKPSIVGNVRIEYGFAKRSSCMTCHFRASVGDGISGDRVVHLNTGRTDVGKPTNDQFGPGDRINFLSTDFIWSAPFRAAPRRAP